MALGTVGPIRRTDSKESYNSKESLGFSIANSKESSLRIDKESLRIDSKDPWTKNASPRKASSAMALHMMKLRNALSDDFSAEMSSLRSILSKEVSEEVGLLRMWMDREVVSRIAHVDKTVAFMRTHITEVVPSSESRSDNRSLQMPLQMPCGDSLIDMDYDIQYRGAPQNGNSIDILSPSRDLPKAGPPTPYNQDLLPLWCLKEESPSLSVSMNVVDVCNTLQSNGVHEKTPINAVSEEESFSRRPSISSHEDIRKKMSNMKRRTVTAWSFLDDPESSRSASRYLRGMVLFTLLSIGVAIVQSVPSQPLTGTPAFVVESSFETVFLVEFFFRFALCPDRIVFCMNMQNIFDLAAGLPFILRVYRHSNSSDDYSATSDSVIGNFLIAAVPMLRVLKAVRGFKQFHLLLSALEQVSEALPICLFAMMALTLSFAAMVFMVEPRDNVVSYPHSVWFVMVSMTTLGYGDVSPSTAAGYIITSILVVVSVMFMAMPLGIIGQAFTTVWQDRDRILLVHGVRNRLRIWGYKPTDIPTMFDMFDNDKSGELDFAEFKHMIDKMHMGLNDVRILELFRSIDADGEGTIDAKEFVQALFPQLHAEDFVSELIEECTPQGSRQSSERQDDPTPT